MNRLYVKKVMTYLSAVLLLSSQTVLADEAQLMNMMKDFQKQMLEMQNQIRGLENTVAVQKGVIEELKQKQVNIQGPSGTEQFSDFDQKLKDKIGDADTWLKGIKFYGDMRLRYEGTNETSGGTSGGFGVDQEQNRFRYQLHWGFMKTFNEQMKIAVRLASGSNGDVTTRNETFDSQFGLKNVGIDHIYATYTPNWAKIGPIKDLEITAGKFANPLFDGSTKMVWDSDVAPEGIYEKFNFDIFETSALNVDGSFLAGQFVVEESGSAGTAGDAELFVYQGGFKSEIEGVMNNPIKVKNMATFYDYSDITSPGNFGGTTKGNFSNAGGLSAEAFDMLEIYNEIGIQPEGLPEMAVFFDWVKNIKESASPALGGGQDTAWYLGGKVGKLAKKGSWETSGGYVWNEANSMPGVFTDSEFGGTDSRGVIVSAAYGITDYLSARTTGYFTGDILGGSLRPDEETRIVQFDLVWKI